MNDHAAALLLLLARLERVWLSCLEARQGVKATAWPHHTQAWWHCALDNLASATRKAQHQLLALVEVA